MFKKVAILSLAIASTSVLAQGAYAAENKVQANVNNQHQAVTADSGLVLLSATYEIKENGVRFRSNPSLSGTVIGLLNKGDMVNGGRQDPVYADGYNWINVYSYKHNAWGWVAVNYVTEIG
ncbi:SH3 domain-containing protein [Paenibacillus thiaminolyticus]|uniref:SH3 domain-containing protein n=1 Tax=Paenibacillus thiaminolyticus TaxID=49283 RepID=A0AAP9J0U8_PANTH|nr:SH3 domain-containing protein [Paenibacillus thiaminolyticus]MCY9538455.1 SH3 domain-containing protein [Paenibacillus thiaminolyticus]MCY9601192.1 SH3 domain-containing protein [Paenibacillus thiaminolyticus]MCY9605880.1 SH3 domain-containing protein [Paenibacillus thiaminolyticus]MCY9611241.1 SH3 domain-containing protein [Paenibacillus thiaminolyticus]MCY9617470.1 SH3 domain-containing protein [Paenibacillus thiaminolyticus]